MLFKEYIILTERKKKTKKKKPIKKTSKTKTSKIKKENLFKIKRVKSIHFSGDKDDQKGISFNEN